MTVRELAIKVGVSKSLIYRKIAQGKISSPLTVEKWEKIKKINGRPPKFK